MCPGDLPAHFAGGKGTTFVYFLVVRIKPGLLPTLGKPSTRKLQPQPWFFSPYRSGHAHNLSWGDNLHFLAAFVSVSRCFSLTPWAALCSSSCKCFGWCLGYFLLELESLTYFFSVYQLLGLWVVTVFFLLQATLCIRV